MTEPDGTEMQIIEVPLAAGNSVEVATVGPADGTPVMYFHSPSTAAGELHAAADAAARFDMRLLSVRRPTLSGTDPAHFIESAARDIGEVVDALGLGQIPVVGWSGGAVHCLASAERLHESVTSVHLVSPVPGPLGGPDALSPLSPRLREVAGTTAESSWAARPTALRDYQALSQPWTFDLNRIDQPVTIWAAADDETVPPELMRYLSDRLADATIIEVDGDHGWLSDNWQTVLGGIASEPG